MLARPKSLLALFALCCTLAPAQTAAHLSRLRQGFASPPAQAKLRCYWWWLNGNTTKETITYELTEMSRKGFGGVLLVDANGSNQSGNDNVPAGPTFGSPAWTKLYLHALKTAAALHLEVTLNITSGWNLGGPDVLPSDASKLLTWSATIADGQKPLGNLPMPAIKNGFYQQIAVLAYPLAHGTALPGLGGDNRTPIRQLRLKAAAAEGSFSMPPTENLLGAVTADPVEADAALASVVDITSMVDDSGHTDWHPPASGPWEILRIGYTDSDAKVSTSSGSWQGLAIDYLDRNAFDTYWIKNVIPLLEVSRPYLRTTLVNLASDSWELGGTNWTGRFRSEFQHRRGYDPVRYLPIVTGRILSDRAISERYLNDLRRTVGDLVTDHYDHFAERAKQYGLGMQAESGGPHAAPIDALETFRSSAVVQTEYWAQSNEHRSTDEDRYFTKEGASAANIYGKQFVAQEGMTSIGPQWSESLASDLKPSFDQGLTEGMNRLVWHAFTSSPASFGLPGNEYFAGTHMNPRITWWSQSAPFFLYLNRAQYLLQQGHAVNDVLYFYGDEVPNFVRLKHDDPAHVLPGYDYDVTDEDALLRTLTVTPAGLRTPAGNTYRLLAMPRGRRLSLASLERIATYVRDGGPLMGDTPLAPTGNVPSEAAARFTQLARDLFGSCPGTHHYGKGLVFCGSGGRAALKSLGILPDFEDPSAQLDYIHRRDGATDIYFIRNRTSHWIDVQPRFRIYNRTPELWNALDGTVTPQSAYTIADGLTTVPMHLAPYGSTFVVFHEPGSLHVTQVLKDGVNTATEVTGDLRNGLHLPNAAPGSYTLKLSDGREMTAERRPSTSTELPPSTWTVAFQPDRGGPATPQTFTAFQDWSTSADAGVRFFSGSATYSTTIEAARVPGERTFLTLTELHEVCSVKINGKPAGTLWAMPYRLDITDRLTTRHNKIELEVTNLWPNRIIGDAQPGETKTYTRTNIRKYTSDSALLPSGLVGPVSLETEADPIARWSTRQ
ncbi:MAG: glycoside hydrolase family 2 sugar binding protein [Acidobacteriaceae bacterium]|nr:glycoside hydrolase family 2 sugar binding protein [Acidobacteriaceae bacterium]